MPSSSPRATAGARSASGPFLRGVIGEAAEAAVDLPQLSARAGGAHRVSEATRVADHRRDVGEVASLIVPTSARTARSGIQSAKIAVARPSLEMSVESEVPAQTQPSPCLRAIRAHRARGALRPR